MTENELRKQVDKHLGEGYYDKNNRKHMIIGFFGQYIAIPLGIALIIGMIIYNIYC